MSNRFGICGMCGFDRYEPLYEFPAYSVRRCAMCGGGKTVRAQDAGDSQRRFNAARYTESREILAGHMMRIARARYALLSRHKPGFYVVEVGCATGEFLTAAHENGHGVTGIETAAHSVEYVASKAPWLDIRNCYLHDSGIGPASVDVLAAFHVLEHIEDLDGFLSTVHGLLRPGGLVFIIVPNLDSWYMKILGRRWWGFSPEHVWHFSNDGLRKAIGTRQFEIVEAGSFELPTCSLWPAMPILFLDIYHRFGNMVAPDGSGSSGGPQTVRKAIKTVLLKAYHLYLLVASVILYPFSLLQQRMGRGYDLFAIARKK